MIRAGADVRHIGAVGRGDSEVGKLLDVLTVDKTSIAKGDAITGHAIIYVDAQSENQIVIVDGANREITETHIRDSLAQAQEGDWLVLQNEANANDLAHGIAREKGMKVALAAAPYSTNPHPLSYRTSCGRRAGGVPDQARLKT